MPKIFFPLPENSEIEVKVNQKIKPGDLLAFREKGGELKILELARLLGVTPKKASRLLVLPLGSRVEQGELLAKKQDFLSFSKTSVFSPISGKISFFDDKTGKLFIQQKDKERFEIKSRLEGKVVKIRENGLEIETENEIFFGKMGFGQEAEGELVFPTLLDRKVGDKIVGVESLGRLVFSKALGLEARGAVTTQISREDLVYFKERDFKFPFVLLAGSDFANLKGFAGREILLLPEEKMLVVL